MNGSARRRNGAEAETKPGEMMMRRAAWVGLRWVAY